MPQDFPFAVDANGRVDPAAVKAALGGYQFGFLDLLESANGYTITASNAEFDSNGRLYHPDGGERTLFEYNMDSKRPLGGLWVALPESRQVIHLISDGGGMYAYAGSGDARIDGLGLNIRASSVSADIVITAAERGTDWVAAFRAHQQRSNEVINALGWAARETATGIPQGAVQGGYDLIRHGADAVVSVYTPWNRGNLSSAMEGDIFGPPTSRWQAAGRTVGELGLPLPGNAARGLVLRGVRALNGLRVAGPLGEAAIADNFVGAAESGSINLMDSTDGFLVNASRRADVDPGGMLDVIAHGDSNSIKIGGRAVDHRTAARVIESDPQFVGQDIRLLSCHTGACPTGFAQNLANKLGVDVVAADNYVWAYPNGDIAVMGGREVGRRLVPVPSQPGQWVRFTPGGN